jgi:D-amino-acid dehydrogenase
MNPQRRDVVVLGGGVVGLACALALLRAGRGVTVLERNTLGSGASHGNCGTITPSLLPMPAPGVVAKGLKWLLMPDAPLRIKPTLDPAVLGWLLRFAAHCNPADFARTAQIKGALLIASRARLEALVRDEDLDCGFRPSGHLTLYRDMTVLAHADAEVAMWHQLGIAVERLDGDACRQREPALNASVVGGFFHPGDAQLRPDQYVAELARRVRALGGKIREQTEISGFRCSDNRIDTVDCLDRRDPQPISFAADEIVFALGAWSPKLGRALGLRLPIQPGKGYSMTWAAQPAAPRQPLILKDRSVCVTAWADGFRLGSTMEFAGYDDSLNPVRLAALTRGAAEFLHTVPTAAPLEQWCGWRPMTSDDLPIIGRAHGLQNLMLATGHGMLGVSLSAITGQLVAELMTGREPSIDLRPFSPDRFARWNQKP